MEATTTGLLTPRFEDAFAYANRIHTLQLRKGSGIPYVSHLLSVTALVLEAGGDEDLAIAALLHDAVEDQGGLPRLHEIEERYGTRVAGIVFGCSDAWEEPKPEWRGRKEHYLERLPREPRDVLLVSAADKVHNARTTLADYRQLGDPVFARFKGGREGTLWYHRACVAAYREAGFESFLVDELDRVVSELESLVARSP